MQSGWLRYSCCHVGVRAPKRLTEVVKVIDLARANNVSIMLTQFQAFKGGALEVRHAVLTGSKLGLERLSLLLQVCLKLRCMPYTSMVFCPIYRACWHHFSITVKANVLPCAEVSAVVCMLFRHLLHAATSCTHLEA